MLKDYTGAPPPIPDKPSKKLSTGQKVLIGCGIGCGTIMILSLVIFGLLAWWMVSPGDQVTTNRILNPDAMAVFRLENISENQGAKDLISHVFQEAERSSQKRSSGQLPPLLEKLRKLSSSQQDPGFMLNFLSPKEVTVSMTSDELGKIHFVIAVNPGIGKRILKTILIAMFFGENSTKENIISTRHGDLYILDKRDPKTGHIVQQGVIGFYKGTLLYSAETGTAKSALERLANGNDSGDLKKALAEPFSRLGEEGWLAYGVMDGEFFKSMNVGQSLSQDGIRFEIEKITAAINFQSGDEAILNVHIDWRNEDSGRMAYDNIENLKNELIEKASMKGLALDVMNQLNGTGHDIEFLVSNLKNAVTDFFRRVENFK